MLRSDRGAVTVALIACIGICGSSNPDTEAHMCVRRSPVMTIVTGLFFSALITQNANAALTGVVVGVSDGDTLTVLDGANRQHRIRLAAIDAPDMQVPSKKS